MNKKKKIIIAMSGGVDSSVSAYILKKIGYEVEGIFMKNWNKSDNEDYCTSVRDFLDAQKIANILKIKLNFIDLSEYYWKEIFIDFIKEIKLGITPNPDISCNKKIKFKIFKNIIEKQFDFDFISTGHYIRKIKYKNNNFILKGIDKKKDQSYFLYRLKSNDIDKYIFPLGNFYKNNIRKIAKDIKFSNYNKKSSTGICFIENNNFKKFIQKFLKYKKGNIITEDDTIIGSHDGYFLYTIGQRKGLKIGGIKNYYNTPWYIINKNIKDNLLIVTQDKKHIKLLSRGLIAKNISFINEFPLTISSFDAYVKIRYDNDKNEINSHITLFNNNKYAKIIFKNKNGVIVPGQHVVIYIGNTCIGGGIICNCI